VFLQWQRQARTVLDDSKQFKLRYSTAFERENAFARLQIGDLPDFRKNATELLNLYISQTQKLLDAVNDGDVSAQYPKDWPANFELFSQHSVGQF
jgi:hypothetical protein